MTDDLSALFTLEKAGLYREALERLEKSRLDPSGLSPARRLNLELLEARLLARLIGTQERGESDVRLESTSPIVAKEKSWSALITMWKRQDYLKEQLAAIRGQSIPPEEIIIVLNDRHISESKIREIGGSELKIIHSDINSLYSRWALAYVAQGSYVSVFDDDVIPGEHWIANAIRACSSYNALVGPSGRIYNREGKHGYFKLVVPDAGRDDENTISCGETDVYCDWVCNSYLFKREWVGHILSNVRYQDSFKTFDDIQLATSLFLSGGIRCVTPMQPTFESRLHGSLKQQYGVDAHAIWKTNSDQHFSKRKEYIESLIQEGYSQVQQRENLFRFHLIVPFGERSYLERCLLSIKGQRYRNFSCTLVDDCHDGGDSLDLLRRLGLDGAGFRYIRTAQKAYPLRAREIATDLLGANPADVIVHLDGDDWLPYPDVLSRLNRIYRKGGVLASYGNALCIRHSEGRDFREYSHYEMSRKWNVAQNDVNADVVPFGRIAAADVSSGWREAPWCGMHLRSFQYAKWMGLNRRSFLGKNGQYLRVATDAAILIPILDACHFSTVVFVPDVAYVYQNAGNTIHAKNEISIQQKREALAVVDNADQVPDYRSVSRALIERVSPEVPDDAIVLHDALHAQPGSERTDVREPVSGPGITSNARSGIATIITPDYLADAIVCLMSYQRNVRIDCQLYVFVATDDEAKLSICEKMLESSPWRMLSPATLQYTRDQSYALAKKYTFGSDEYRWAMKSVVLLEILKRGNSTALFLDPDTYTVSDITDIHQTLTRHSISVFPHFRDPDHEYLRGVLYKDGFFNGGMLAATLSGTAHLDRLYERCLHELVKDSSRHRWDDQKYFDLFPLEVEQLHVNLDRGIDYNPWNYEPVEGLIAPSQRSVLLRTGYFVRHWHVSTMLIKNSIELKEKKFSVYRPLVSIYLLSLLYVLLLLMAHAKRKGGTEADCLGLARRYDSIEEKLRQLSADIPIDRTRCLLVLAQRVEENTLEEFLLQWTASLSESICFDNFELFALIAESLFFDREYIAGITHRIRRRDLRYIADEVVGGCDVSREKTEALLEEESAGELIRRQLKALQACKIHY